MSDVYLILRLLGVAIVFALAVRTGQADGGLLLTVGAAALWPVMALMVLAGMAFDLLVFIYRFIRKPH